METLLIKTAVIYSLSLVVSLEPELLSIQAKLAKQPFIKVQFIVLWAILLLAFILVC